MMRSMWSAALQLENSWQPVVKDRLLTHRGSDQAKPAWHAMCQVNYKSRIPATIMAVLPRTVTRRGFLICALCSLAIVGSAWSATTNPAICPVALYDTFSRSAATPPTGFDVSFEGVFTAIIGTDVVSGTSRMDVKRMPGGTSFTANSRM